MNKIDKNKSPIAVLEEAKRKTKYIYEEFNFFADGYRILFLIYRGKDGGPTNNRFVRKIITRNKKEWQDALLKLVVEQSKEELPYRVYASVNERNIEKSIRQFKYEQLESDYYDQIQKENFYLDIKNRFIGCLMQPAQRKTSYFLFDIDKVEGIDVQGTVLDILPNEHIIKMYPTKNGWHIITNAFNYTKLDLPNFCELKKDGLLLLSF